MSLSHTAPTGSTPNNVIPLRKPSLTRLACVKCGAETDAACNCGVEYKPAGQRAAEAVAQNPTKSDRLIADDIGVGRETVRRARKQLPHDGAVAEKRIGKDRKTRKLPKVRKSACDIDWEHPDPKDFASRAEMFGEQADNYVYEAGHLARAYPLLNNRFASRSLITKDRIQDAKTVVTAWSEVVSKLEAKLPVKKPTLADITDAEVEAAFASTPKDDPKNATTAFMIRADEAGRMGKEALVLADTILPADIDDAITAAKYAADAWQAVYENLKVRGS